jgi:hypothetical protein
MSTLTIQLQQLKKQQEELEKRIQEEKESKQKLENELSIERLEVLVQPLTDMLDMRDNHGSQRERLTIHYKQEMQKYNNRLIREPYTLSHSYYPPQKNKQLLEEEIYITIISILKKQQERIGYLESKLGESI